MDWAARTQADRAGRREQSNRSDRRREPGSFGTMALYDSKPFPCLPSADAAPNTVHGHIWQAVLEGSKGPHRVDREH